jgi:hypothetical protein
MERIRNDTETQPLTISSLLNDFNIKGLIENQVF